MLIDILLHAIVIIKENWNIIIISLQTKICYMKIFTN